MFRLIKWTFRLIVLVIIIAGGWFLYSTYFNQQPDFSSTQTETIALMGLPEQFYITYLPKKGEKGDQLIRQETWVYPSKQKKFSFLGGALASTGDLESASSSKPTMLNPKDFDFYTDLKDVEQIVGKVNLASIELPGFYDPENEIQTYASKEAVFIFEQGYLTFVETVY